MEWTTGNPKTAKGESLGYLTAVLHLSPAWGAGLKSANGTPISVCPSATPGCIAGCLNKAGRAGIPHPAFSEIIQGARRRRTLELFADRTAYKAKLLKELLSLRQRAKLLGLTLVVRPNGTSDLPWLAHDLARALPEVQFYDYTKIPKPWQRETANYHLTFSRSEANDWETMEALRNGINVAVVFDTRKGRPLPESWRGFRVIDGDEHDLRFLDPRERHGVIVGLHAKGPAKKDASGFVVKTYASITPPSLDPVVSL
jgi:hypothetical protein